MGLVPDLQHQYKIKKKVSITVDIGALGFGNIYQSNIVRRQTTSALKYDVLFQYTEPFRPFRPSVRSVRPFRPSVRSVRPSIRPSVRSILNVRLASRDKTCIQGKTCILNIRLASKMNIKIYKMNIHIYKTKIRISRFYIKTSAQPLKGPYINLHIYIYIYIYMYKIKGFGNLRLQPPPPPSSGVASKMYLAR